jgi:hypothetical protein
VLALVVGLSLAALPRGRLQAIELERARSHGARLTKVGQPPRSLGGPAAQASRRQVRMSSSVQTVSSGGGAHSSTKQKFASPSVGPQRAGAEGNVVANPVQAVVSVAGGAPLRQLLTGQNARHRAPA